MRGSGVHLIMTGVWVLALVPTLTIWKTSILWIAFMSIWANVVSHATAYEAARAKELQQHEASTTTDQPSPLPHDDDEATNVVVDDRNERPWVAP